MSLRTDAVDLRMPEAFRMPVSRTFQYKLLKIFREKATKNRIFPLFTQKRCDVMLAVSGGISLRCHLPKVILGLPWALILTEV